jgi:magnesium transporter
MASRKRSSKAGLPPGSLVHIGEDRQTKSRITVIDYTLTDATFKEQAKIEDCCVFRDKQSVTWINIDGLHDVSVIEKLGGCFGLHPLIQEDILNTEQRPKTEDYGSYIFIILRMLSYDEKLRDIQSEQVSLVIGQNFVLSFQESEGDVWDPVRERIRNNKGASAKKAPTTWPTALWTPS